MNRHFVGFLEFKNQPKLSKNMQTPLHNSW